jgi:hypothetical protein
MTLTCLTLDQDARQDGLISVTTMRKHPIEPRTEDYAVDSYFRTGRLGDSEIKRMSNDNDQTKLPAPEFDFSAFPPNTLFHERRTGRDRRTRSMTNTNPEPQEPQAPGERRTKKERRRRIDPTTFEKQYSEDEMEFMNAVQRFKEQTGKAFPSYGEVLKVAVELGYRRCTLAPGLTPPAPDDATSHLEFQSADIHDRLTGE